MTQLKPGTKLKSAVCDAEVMIIKSTGAHELTCGGAPMLGPDETANGDASPDDAQMEGCQVGKRYISDDETLEVLCVKAGQGSLAADGSVLGIKGTKKLPSSD
ncbi:MAG: hypothetical protein ACODAC_04990 [Pseudomonadota bacterium]